MPNEVYSAVLAQVANGINLDADPSVQPKGSRRYTLNTVERSSNGRVNLSNEPSNSVCGSFPIGHIPIGDRYVSDGDTVVILTSPTGEDSIGIVGKTGKYEEVVHTRILHLDVRFQCDIKFRIRRGKERVIYWTDGKNNARSFNFDRLHNYYNDDYKLYLKQLVVGAPDVFTGEKWDEASFDLIKTYKSIPSFDDVDIVEYGSITPGSYNFAIQYVDDDLNPTDWANVSNTVNIYNDSWDLPYERIRGSRNANSGSQSFPKATKTVKLTISNLDTNFPYYRIGVIRATSGTGVPEKVLASELNSTTSSIFLYSGNDESLTEVPIGDILIDKEIIYQPKHNVQIDNILLLLNGKGKSINWCDFQQYASKIKSDLVTKPVILNSIFSEPNTKTAKYTFEFRDYMPGEVYSFAIAWAFDDGYISPAFHIPGRNISDTSSKMLHHELEGRYYIDTHNCSRNYWGNDAMGEPLEGKKIRHHRFPFRHDPNVNKPLVTTTTTATTINRYKLAIAIGLTVPNTYPLDSNGVALVIGYKFRFKIKGHINTNSFAGFSTELDVINNVGITIYDDTSELDLMPNGEYYELDPDCELARFQDMGGVGSADTFVFTDAYTTYPVARLQNTDTSEIFGITFSGITKPREDVVGFYILRQERLDEDRIIIDNGVFGPLTVNKDYHTFGTLLPKDYYPANNCGTPSAGDYTPVVRSKDALWFFNPEYEYLQKKTGFERLEVGGVYKERNYQMPTVGNRDTPCDGTNFGDTMGVYIDDVQAGTSYNPDINKDKDKDDDGFDLVIGYRNYNMDYVQDHSPVLPNKTNAIYLTAASYQNYGSNAYYNTSVDNKIGMYIAEGGINTSIFHNAAGATGGKSNLIYASMVTDNKSSYSNFMSREYYKEHNNLVKFEEGVKQIDNFEVYNGDASISSTNIVSSVFYSMVMGTAEKKRSLWKIVVGAVLVVAGVVLTVVGVGPAVAAAGIGVLLSSAISYGVSLIMSGIKLNQMLAMMNEDYENGLKDAVQEGGIWECLRESLAGSNINPKSENGDDTIRWFADRISNIYIESTIPMGVRVGLTGGVPDFTDSPAPYNEGNFRSYLTEKMTSLDKEQGSGRLYRGYASAEIYDINLDYMRFNKQKVFMHLPLEYDCCADFRETFPRRIWQSQKSFQEELVDNYRVFLPNNYMDIEGEHGEITGCYRLGNNLYIQTEEATWQLPQTQQERVTNEIVSFVGTGGMFSILPRKIIDDDKGSLGTLHKWANCKTRMGMLSVSESEHKIFFHADKISEISAEGLQSYCQDNIREFLADQLYLALGIDFPNSNNPANPNGTGYHSTYDATYDRLVITKRDYLILPDKIDDLGTVTTKPAKGTTDFVYCLEDQCFYQGNKLIPLTDRGYFEDKSFTLSYSLLTRKWVSWHSYIPTFFIHAKDRMYSYVAGSNNIWLHNVKDHYHTYYNKHYPHIIEGVATAQGMNDSMFEDITIRTRAASYHTINKQYLEKRFITFNKITIYNDRQCSGELYMDVKQLKSPQDYFAQQTTRTVGAITIDKVKENWNINGFRDYVIDYDEALFTSDWTSISTIYPIDKVVNGAVTSYNKDWRQLETFKGRYIIFRLKFDNFDTVNLITDFLLSTTAISE